MVGRGTLSKWFIKGCDMALYLADGVGEDEVLLDDGQTYTFSYTLQGTEDEGSATVVVVAEDLAGRAAIAIDNARLYRDIQEADRRKNEFMSMLAHELRNPLATMQAALEVVDLKLDHADASVRSALDRARRDITHEAGDRDVLSGRGSFRDDPGKRASARGRGAVDHWPGGRSSGPA